MNRTADAWRPRPVHAAAVCASCSLVGSACRPASLLPPEIFLSGHRPPGAKDNQTESALHVVLYPGLFPQTPSNPKTPGSATSEKRAPLRLGATRALSLQPRFSGKPRWHSSCLCESARPLPLSLPTWYLVHAPNYVISSKACTLNL